MFGVFYDLSLEKDDKTPTSKTTYTFPDLCMDGSAVPAASKGETTAVGTASSTQATNQSAANTNAKVGTPVTTPTQTSSPLLQSMNAKSAKMATSDPNDLSPSEQDKGHLLLATVSGEALNEYQQLSDVEIVSKCLACLRRMFPTEDVPAPSGYVVSRWGADPFAQMSYSYVAVGSTGEDYDYMAQDAAGKIFFAGEV